MVTRKPVPTSYTPPPLQQTAPNPPYPTDSTMQWQQEQAGEDNRSPTRSRRSSASSANTWNSGFDSDDEAKGDGVSETSGAGPKATTNTSAEEQRTLPDSLRPGPSPSSQHPAQTGSFTQQNPWAVQETSASQSIQPPVQSHNPYLRAQRTGQTSYVPESTQDIWQEPALPPPPPPSAPPPAPPAALAEAPILRAPYQDMSSMSLEGPFGSDFTNGLQDTLSPGRPSAGLDRQHSHSSSNPWQEDLDREEQHQNGTETQSSLLDEPSLMDEVPPPMPPRPAPINISQTTSARDSPVPETPMTRARKQRNETYQIKHINWMENGQLRTSPMLAQNANGPCPLLALVNALALSTPDSESTALVETLRSRENVSLGLLLDAVFEELARRNEISDHELPDVGDLYSFLITLHTGMNVNPSFVASPTPKRGSIEVDPVTVDGIHPAYRNRTLPGVFEETREMTLYSTFDIPLIHGWIPPVDSQAYAAFDRSAKTFDEALNIQFREEELEDKLRTQGLGFEEQQLYEDLTSIKEFLADYPTQLTEYGLDIAAKAIKAGQIAILFRNDHFSTLYKEPQSGTLMTLVTDAGYSSHDEIVWETLVDVSGAASELLSGDFRPVGNSTDAGVQQPDASVDAFNTASSDGWETVPPRRGRYNTSRHNSESIAEEHRDESSVLAPPPELGRKTSEQEDHDLALALQLQEEEEDRRRRDNAQRDRENELSRQFLENETTAAEQRPPIPPRRSNLNGVSRNNNRSSSGAAPSADAPYVRASSGADDNPPTYEQAASDRPYRPPGSAPHTLQGHPLNTLNALEQEQAGYLNRSTTTVNSTSPGMGHRRRSSMMGSSSGGQRLQRRQSNLSRLNQAAGGEEGQPPGTPSGEERCIMM